MQPRNPQDLLRVDPKESEATSSFSLKHLTAYSVSWLDRWAIPSLYENVTVLNARLFPDRFTLKGFPELPDADATNRSILQMRPKYSGLATSDRQKGVFLTEKGRREAKRITDAIGPPTINGQTLGEKSAETSLNLTQHPKRTYDAAAEIAERRSRLLFQRYQENRLAETEVVHFLGFLGLYDHTPPAELRREFDRIRKAASDSRDDEFLVFMDSVADRFKSYLNRSKPA